MRQVPNELMELMADGLPRVSRYDEFLRITKQDDTAESFVIWAQAAFTLMQAPQGKA